MRKTSSDTPSRMGAISASRRRRYLAMTGVIGCLGHGVIGQTMRSPFFRGADSRGFGDEDETPITLLSQQPYDPSFRSTSRSTTDPTGETLRFCTPAWAPMA